MTVKIVDGVAMIEETGIAPADIDVAASGRKTFELIVPVEHEGSLLTQITLRPLKVKDMVAVQRLGGDQVEMTFNLFAQSAGLPRSVIDELSIPDAEVLLPEVDAISGKSTRASAKDSS